MKTNSHQIENIKREKLYFKRTKQIFWIEKYNNWSENSLQWFNSQFEQAKNQRTYESIETTQFEEQKEKNEKNKQSFKSLQDTNKHINIYLTGVPEDIKRD